MSVTAIASTPSTVETYEVELSEAYGDLPLTFIKNTGRMDSSVRFFLQGADYSAFFTDEGVYFSTVVMTDNDAKEGAEASSFFRLLPLDTHNHVRVDGETTAEGTSNFIVGKDTSQWVTGAINYRSVIYRNIYEGIDLRFYGEGSLLEYDVIVHPGADPEQVVFAYEGSVGVQVSDEGGLIASLFNSTDTPILTQRPPLVYQEIEGQRSIVDGHFSILSDRPAFANKGPANRSMVYGFELAAYNEAYPLVIDPVIEYSSYLGGSRFDHGTAITVDDQGHAYLTGITYAPDFPIINAVQSKFSGPKFAVDVFVSKLNKKGDGFVYSTYIGGRGDGTGNKTRSGKDQSKDIAVDQNGNAYVTGMTWSDDFPVTKNALQKKLNDGSCPKDKYCHDAFVFKLDASGKKLVYSTFLGGTGDETAAAITADSQGNTYVTGRTQSSDFPLLKGLKDAPKDDKSCTDGTCGDAFISKISSDGKKLLFSTLLGGKGSETATALALDKDNNIYVAGITSSSDFPVVTPLQMTNHGSGDAFITKLNNSADKILYSTFLGGKGGEGVSGIALGPEARVYLSGYTYSADFPVTEDAYDTTFNNKSDSFVSSLDLVKNSLVFSTYLGGSGHDLSYGVGVDSDRNVYIGGKTDSADFPLVEPFQKTVGTHQTGFIARFDKTGSKLLFSTFFGGGFNDGFLDIAVDNSGSVYAIGSTSSEKYPVVNFSQDHHRGGGDANYAKISFQKKNKQL